MLAHGKRCAIPGIALSLIALLTVSGATAGHSQIEPDARKINIDNFGRINHNYYRGAQPQGSDYKDLADFGIKAVVDLERSGEDDEQQMVEAAGMKFYRIGMTATSRPEPKQIDDFLKIVSDPTNQPVYVHCHGGRHRTGLVTAIYRIERDGWDANRAYKEMKDYEFKRGIGHSALKHYLYEYYEKFTGRSAAQPTAEPVSRQP